MTKKTVRELKDIIVKTAGEEFFEFENHPCDLEEVEKHYREHGYKPKEHGYIELRNRFGKLLVANKACLVVVLVKLKLYHMPLEVKFRAPISKKYPRYAK